MLDKLNTPTMALAFLLGFIALSQYAQYRYPPTYDCLTPKQIHALDVIAALTPKQKEALKFVEEVSDIWNVPIDKRSESRTIIERE